MLMLANRHTPIHERLWCVYEAFLAYLLGIAVRIAGEALHLLSGDLAEFLRLKEGAAKRMVDESRAQVEEAVARRRGGQSEHEGRGGTPPGNTHRRERGGLTASALAGATPRRRSSAGGRCSCGTGSRCRAGNMLTVKVA